MSIAFSSAARKLVEYCSEFVGACSINLTIIPRFSEIPESGSKYFSFPA